ncbi:MAG TPA: hypothetical protein VHM94_16600 [Acidimicrobiia bacterium]|jgi:hypothetical protein|nr:hypothetical protein [Acidimicrobiia bacterium]
MSVFTKLNLKDQDPIVVVDAPESFEEAVAALDEVTVHRSFAGVVDFAIGFGTTLDKVEAFAAGVKQHTEGDAVVWFAYPKSSSKRYTCEFNRDTGWESLGTAGFEPVRQVAIDEDWSALRFRRVEFIKTMTRDTSGAITQAGKRRTQGR